MDCPNPLRPDRMTAAERRAELCRILARGIVRLRMRDAQLSARESEFRLPISPDQSGGANPPIRRTA